MPVLYEIALQEKISFQWIGWPHIIVEDESEQREIAEILLTEYRCIPLFLDEEILQHFTKFCNGIIFPIFHNIIDTSTEAIPQYPIDLWDAYRRVNTSFAEKIKEVYSGQMIWIHDYQLLLCPSYISRRTHSVFNIGLYLHSPFPSSEIYRVLPHREAILHAMLCCDLIGFHLFEYARHFLTSCKRLLGLDHNFSQGGYLSLNCYGRNIIIRIGHLGVEPSLITKSLASESFAALTAQLAQKYKYKKVLLGIDSQHRISGVPLKLEAFRQALLQLQQFKSKVVLVQLLVEAKNSSQHESDEILQDILNKRDEVNEELGENVVEIVHSRSIKREERYAYMRISYGVINTSIREGLCLIPFEYLLVNRDKPTNIISSEFAGVSRALCSPKRINPFDLIRLRDELCDLVSQSSHSIHPSAARDAQYILDNTTFKWARNYLTDLKRAQKDTKHFQYDVSGLGENLKLITLSKKFKHLKGDTVLKAYRESRNRIFFFDNEGTLANSEQTPSERILTSIQELCNDDNNVVFVVTGRERAVLHTAYSSITGLGMAAEYGSFIKWNDKNEWQQLPQTTSLWKETAHGIISAYVNRTEGSYMIEKECSVVFFYRNTDPDLGAWQAKDLTSHLEILLKHFMNECEVSNGLGYVEVKPRGINKGTTVYSIIQKLHEKRGPVDFLLAVGDDISDEEMFRVIKAMKAENSRFFSLRSKLPVLTCTVGRKPSLARYYVNDANEIEQYLEILRGWSNVSKKNLSSDDLSIFHRRVTALGSSSRLDRRSSSGSDISEDELMRELDVLLDKA